MPTFVYTLLHEDPRISEDPVTDRQNQGTRRAVLPAGGSTFCFFLHLKALPKAPLYICKGTPCPPK